MYERNIEYFSGQGDVLMAKLDPVTGRPGAFRHVSNVTDLELEFKVEKVSKTESMSGQRLKSLELVKSKEVSYKATLESFSQENLKMALFGSDLKNEAGEVAETTLQSDLLAGDIVALSVTNLLTLTVKDSTPTTPKSLIKGTDYDFDEYGAIKFINVTGVVQPFKVSGTKGASSGVVMFTEAAPAYAIRFQGLNTSQGNRKVLVELYKAAPEPLKQLALISDDPGSIAIEGSLLADFSRPAADSLGYFGRLTYLD